MRRAAFLLLCVLIPALCGAEPIRLQAGKTTRLPVAGATAAFSLNPVYAEASAAEGVVTISGNQPGSTNIVVVTSAGTQTFDVVVVEPPRVYPPGFQESSVLGTESRASSYEFRYSSAPSQQQNVVDVVERTGGRSFRFHLANANLFDADLDAGYSAVRFPSVSYEMKAGDRAITFLDQDVVSSPLTIENALVRGVHVQAGPWTVHAGYSSLSAFQNFFLPADREATFGGTYERRVNTESRLAANLYVFPSRHATVTGIGEGVVGSVLYEYKRPADLTVIVETGVSRGAGLAFRAEKTKGKSQYRHNIRYKSTRFAGLSTDSSRGLLADGSWTRPLSDRLELRTNYFANRYSLPQFRQTNVGANATFRYDLTRRWSFNGGGTFAHLKPEAPPGPGVDATSLPLGVDFKSRFFSGGYQHVFTRNDGQDSGGHEDRVNAGTGWGSWRLNTFWDRQTQAPTADFIVSETPGLRDVLDRLGVTATSAEQIAQLIQQDAVLLQLGYLKDVRLNLTPVRTQAGANLVWAGHGPLAPQVTASFLRSQHEMLLGSARTDIGTLSFVCRLPARFDLFASWSLFSTSAPGSTLQRRSLLDFSLRRRFSGAPDWLFPNRGSVSGRVFEDGEQRGEWGAASAPLADVVVVLDGTRQTRTGRDGRFRFAGVSLGAHDVEVLFESDRPFYFTTPSTRRLSPNSQADFGVAFATAMIVGFLKNDAGTGVEGIQVAVSGRGRTSETTTDSDGKFTIRGLLTGTYDAVPNADSFPPGYVLTDVAAKRVQAESDAPGRVEFTVRASRAIAGIVTVYDRSLAKQVPVEGVVVRLRATDRQSTTGRDGAYIFRDLPAGEFTIVASFGGQDFVRTERLAPQPTFIRDANISVGARDQAP